MSDPKSTYGDPVEEPTASDDVVGRANEGLAHAEAAGRAVDGDEAGADRAAGDPDAGSSVSGSAGVPSTSVVADGAASSSDRVAHDDDAARSAAAHADHDDAARAAAARSVADDADARLAAAHAADPAPHKAAPAAHDDEGDAYVPGAYSDRLYDDGAGDRPTVVAPAATATAAAAGASAAGAPRASESVVAEPAGRYDAPTTVASSPQPIFVQAPEAPRPRGNRGAAGLIGLLAALSFGVLYLGVWLGLGALAGEVTAQNVGTTALAALTTGGLWAPVVVFFLAFWLLGAIINRGRWGKWVIFGIVVGVAAWGGHVLGQLFDAPFWLVTAREAAGVVEEQLLAPLAIAAFILGRELTIWFGAWVAARGARVTELNEEAQREYERTLEAGPQLARV